jgi:hypothetical protein
MTKLITRQYHNHVALQIKESFTEAQNNIYYAVASRHIPYATGDSDVPTPTSSVQELAIDFYDNAIFSKKISNTDVLRVVNRHDWVANTAYASYNHTDGSIYDKNFFVVAQSGSNYNVYKVLDNNGGAVSTEQPTDTDASAASFKTLDNYTWKYMYSVSNTIFGKFASTDFIPVIPDANVTSNAVSGSIDIIKVTNPGSNYVSTLTGQFGPEDLRDSIASNSSFTSNTTTYRLNANAASNANFYSGSSMYLSSGAGAGQLRNIVTYNPGNRVAVIEAPFTTSPDTTTQYLITPSVLITGDGDGAVAYAVVNSNATTSNYIDGIQVISRGSGYSFASARVVGNTGGISNTAVVVPIIPPAGGHGSNVYRELGSKAICISIDFDKAENGFITTENDFRTYAIVKDPLISSATLGLDDIYGTFVSGERVAQIEYKTLAGIASANSTSTTVSGTGTEFQKALKVGDTVYLRDDTNNTQSVRTVTGITNNSLITVNSNNSFACSFCKIAHAVISATGTISSINTPQITLTRCEPRFRLEETIVGLGSGAQATVNSISIQDKSYNNWNTLDNRTRISYTSKTGTMPEDSLVYQQAALISNAYFHSANDTYIFLTSDKGPINADPTQNILADGQSASFTPGSIKYNPDMIKGSGEVLYVENFGPISRSSSQKETIKVYFDF